MSESQSIIEQIGETQRSIFHKYREVKQGWFNGQEILFKIDDPDTTFDNLPLEYFYDVRDGTNKFKLVGEDEVVIYSRIVDVYFQYPPESKVFFRLETPNDEGFTRKELAKLLVKRWFMLYYIAYSYDIDKGEFDPNGLQKHVFDKDSPVNKNPFRPVAVWEYNNNWIEGLIYDRDQEAWHVSFQEVL